MKLSLLYTRWESKIYFRETDVIYGILSQILQFITEPIRIDYPRYKAVMSLTGTNNRKWERIKLEFTRYKIPEDWWILL
jgi:hypothetical protein